MKARLPRLAAPLPRDKADTLLLLASSLLVLAPHAAHLPLWVSLVCGATLAWRGAITLLGRRMPPSLLLLPLALVAMAGVMRTYDTLLGRDAGVAMLVLLVAFKMLEMHARRDLYVVVFLCFFLVLTNFFYSQGIGTALLMVASVVALLTTQISFQFTGAVPALRARLLMGGRMLAFAAPIAALLFVLFPRIQGPLWGMPGDATGGRSGLSDRMAPGQISRLAQSEETVFRVKFEGAAPPQAQLYWRGLVLGAFDGRTWTRVPAQRRQGRGRELMAVSVRGHPLHYQVTLEPSNTRWLFALEMPDRVPELSGNMTFVSPELELASAYPVEQRVRYDVTSYPDFRLQAAPQLDSGTQWLQLPYGRNPQTLAAGHALRSERDPAARVAAVLAWFRRENFVYTLEPPLLGKDPVDEFLYRTRAGFCEHYAGAFVVLMRAAGIPARVVTGYQGGEMNPLDGYLTVRQSDAHAWAEVWIAGRGWVRVDPTGAVAPERVRRGLARALPPSAPFGIEGLGRLMRLESGDNPWLAQLRYTMSAMNNGWNQWVLNYTPERQRGVLAALHERLLDWRTALVLVLGFLAVFFTQVLLRRSLLDPVDTLYSAMCNRLGQLGVSRAPDEGPHALAERVARSHLAPERQAAATDFLRRYGAYRYGRNTNDANLVPTLKHLLSQLR